jgi:anti-sigma regulatory factor (Ser/Thr protein kinase)
VTGVNASRQVMVGDRQPTHARFPVGAEADVAAVRREVAHLVDQLSPDEDRHGRAELVATELATNLVRHAGGGWLLARALPPSTLELIAVDDGPGVTDLAGALAGRVSDPKGLGCGLRAVRRGSARFDAWTRPGRGTVILSVVDIAGGKDDSGRQPEPRRFAGVSVGIVEPCGDGWAVAEDGDVLTVAVVDGLGHGAKASLATDAALAEFAALGVDDLERFVPRANARMRDTRGAAVTMCRIDAAEGVLRYFAFGNVNGRVVTGAETRGLVTYGGTLGLHVQPPRTRVAAVPFPAGASLVLWTDGLSTRVVPDPELFDHDPAVAATILYRDHARNRDDATVVVVTSGGTR